MLREQLTFREEEKSRLHVRPTMETSGSQAATEEGAKARREQESRKYSLLQEKMDIPFNKGQKSIRVGQNYYLSRRLMATSGQRQSRKKQKMM